MSNTGYIPASVRNAVAKRDRGICTHCGARAAKAQVSKRGILQFFGADGRVFHLDHVKPSSTGGKSTLQNMTLSCAACNMSKRRAKAANDPDVQALLAEFE